MGFKLLILNPSEQGETAYVDTWSEKLKDKIPDVIVHLSKSVGEAMEVIGEEEGRLPSREKPGWSLMKRR